MKINLLSKQDRKTDKYYILYLIIIVFLYFLNVTPSKFLFISGSLATILFSWIIVIEYRLNPIRITPILVLLLFPLLMLGISAIYHSFIYQYQDYETLGPIYISSKSIVIAYLIVAVGLFFQLLGLQLFRPNILQKQKVSGNKREIKIFKYFIIFLLISKLTEEYATLGIIQNLLNTLPLAILIFIAIHDPKNKITNYSYKRNSILIGSFLLFASSLIMLSKTILLFSIVPVFLFFLIQAEKRTKYKVIITFTLTVALYFLFIQPLVTNARLFLGKQNLEPTQEFVSKYITSGEYNIPVYATPYRTNAVETFLNRVFELNAPAYIYELTERSGFQNGKTFQNIAVGMIPRIFWPDKPSIPQGQRFSAEYIGYDKVNIGMLISGELFWNFGFLGVIVGSLLIGLSLGYIWQLINLLALKNFYYFAYYFYLLQSCLGGSEFSAVLVGALQLIIVFFIIRYFHLFIVRK